METEIKYFDSTILEKRPCWNLHHFQLPIRRCSYPLHVNRRDYDQLPLRTRQDAAGQICTINFYERLQVFATVMTSFEGQEYPRLPGTDPGTCYASAKQWSNGPGLST